MHFDWIDRWKGFLIVLVVAGHVFGGAEHLCTGSDSIGFEFIYKIIYMFHMPAFFWLVGMCWRDRDETWRDFLKKKAWRLLLPYFVFGLFSSAAYLFVANGGNLFAQATDGYYLGKDSVPWWQPFVSLLHAGSWPNGEGFRCNSVLWFLPVMFMCCCGYRVLTGVLAGPKAQLVVAVVMLVAEFIRRRIGLNCLPWGLSLLPWYGAFVIFGRWIRLDKVNLSVTYLWLGWLVFILLCWIEPNYHRGQYIVLWYCVFVVMAVFGIALSVWTAKLLRGRHWISLGSASLGIMLIHKFLIVFFQIKLPFIATFSKSSHVLLWVANCLVLVLSVFMSYGLSRLLHMTAPWMLGGVQKRTWAENH